MASGRVALVEQSAQLGIEALQHGHANLEVLEALRLCVHTCREVAQKIVLNRIRPHRLEHLWQEAAGVACEAVPENAALEKLRLEPFGDAAAEGLVRSVHIEERDVALAVGLRRSAC